ncbi:MAG: hypothetical protein JRJ85_28510 [Deltaproteobacteria bacterium]|nr:hypothetical protein [Deltaproteobacteria bacterium]
MSEKLFETIKLENDLDLEIWDLSRVIAGDRWLVSLEARINVPITIEHLETLPDKEKILAILKDTLGRKISYRYIQEKFFVDKNKNPDFARKLVLSKYRELKAKKPHLFSES